jgi:hypothetical protein
MDRAEQAREIFDMPALQLAVKKHTLPVGVWLRTACMARI